MFVRDAYLNDPMVTVPIVRTFPLRAFIKI